MRIRDMIWWGTAAILALTVFSTGLGCGPSRPGASLVDGRLRPCPQRPNCVSSQSPLPGSHIAPLVFDGSPEKAWQKLKEAVIDLGGTVCKDQPGYLWTTFTSRVFRFVDDAEFRMVPDEGVIHVRSAARVGYTDLGVNRRRMERLRVIFNRKVNSQR